MLPETRILEMHRIICHMQVFRNFGNKVQSAFQDLAPKFEKTANRIKNALNPPKETSTITSIAPKEPLPKKEEPPPPVVVAKEPEKPKILTPPPVVKKPISKTPPLVHEDKTPESAGWSVGGWAKTVGTKTWQFFLSIFFFVKQIIYPVD